eukprot:1161657-Pelagomonas_calceolata.AAC.5
MPDSGCMADCPAVRVFTAPLVLSVPIVSAACTGKGASGEQLPQAHTCFMQLTLPRYQTRKDLVTALKTALKHAEKFDMA